MVIEKEFREIVLVRMKSLNLSRTELAKRAGIGVPMVSQYLNGKIRPGPEVIERFFAAIGLVPQLRAIDPETGKVLRVKFHDYENVG